MTREDIAVIIGAQLLASGRYKSDVVWQEHAIILDKSFKLADSFIAHRDDIPANQMEHLG